MDGFPTTGATVGFLSLLNGKKITFENLIFKTCDCCATHSTSASFRKSDRLESRPDNLSYIKTLQMVPNAAMLGMQNE